MSPELEVLDQLSGCALPLGVIRQLFDSSERYTNALLAMLIDGQVRLLGPDRGQLPQYRWRQILEDMPAGILLDLTDAGARRTF